MALQWWGRWAVLCFPQLQCDSEGRKDCSSDLTEGRDTVSKVPSRHCCRIYSPLGEARQERTMCDCHLLSSSVKCSLCRVSPLLSTLGTCNSPILHRRKLRPRETGFCIQGSQFEMGELESNPVAWLHALSTALLECGWSPLLGPGTAVACCWRNLSSTIDCEELEKNKRTKKKKNHNRIL